jgi:CubicO group peptidase (beta-lactamase class C family)
MKITRFYCSIVLLLFSGSLLFAQGLDAAKIDALVDKVFETTPSVGIAVAVVKDGELIHSRGYGKRAIEVRRRSMKIPYLPSLQTRKLLLLRLLQFL